MKLIIASVLGAACALALTTSAFAATQPHVIHVSLLGEAAQPMSIKLDESKGKAGAFEFDVTNDAIGTDHEMVLVKLKSPDQKIAADTKQHRVNEDALKSLGEVAGVKPGKTGVLKVKLNAGSYMLLCNHKSHYELGMATAFTVTN